MTHEADYEVGFTVNLRHLFICIKKAIWTGRCVVPNVIFTELKGKLDFEEFGFVKKYLELEIWLGLALLLLGIFQYLKFVWLLWQFCFISLDADFTNPMSCTYLYIYYLGKVKTYVSMIMHL